VQLNVPVLHATEAANVTYDTIPSAGMCRFARWLSMLGMEPTATRRGLDRHRATVEHNLRGRAEGNRSTMQRDEGKPA
jgi:hypothetical protein